MLCWVKVVRIGILVLFLILRESFQLFTIDMTLAVVLSYTTFIMLSYGPSIFTLWRGFFKKYIYHKWILNFVKSLSCSYWGAHMIFILHFVNLVYHHIDLRIHGNSPHKNTEWVAYPFSSGYFWPGNRIRVSCIAGGLCQLTYQEAACGTARWLVWRCWKLLTSPG